MSNACGECFVSEKRIVVIAGPTASGKSSLAVDTAIAFNGVVINADSMQVYKGIPIITACPTLKEREAVPHQLFEIYDCSVRGNVVDWLDLAQKEIESAWKQDKLPVVVGGTGFYIDNLINGTTAIPQTSDQVRQRVAAEVEKNGLESIYEHLKVVDPIIADKLSPSDKTRVMRAYEVWADTGIAISKWYQKPLCRRFADADFYVIKICPSTEELDQRCYLRFDQMIKEGALDEIRLLNERHLNPSLPAMKALGVPELLAYINGNASLEDAVNAAKLHTRQYAKRQRTWFRHKLSADKVLDHCYTGDSADLPF
jgi:tRNA dimethylallyltransferase